MTEASQRSSVTGDRNYVVAKCTEESDPSLVAEAFRIHGAGYLSMGFLSGEALTDEGFVHPDIDRSRGATTEYYLAANRSNAGDCATLRKVRLRPGASIEDFDCYELCRKSLSPEGEAFVAEMSSRPESVVEISALARTPDASPAAVWHLLRTAIHDSMAKEEHWFFCLVVSTFESLASHMGPSFMSILGDDVSIEDGRVNSDVTLRPITFDTLTFLDSMLADHERAAGRPRSRLERSLLFFSDGLAENALSPAVAAFRADHGRSYSP